MTEDNKWAEFHAPTYRIHDLGRPAVFLIPTSKLTNPMGDTTVDEAIAQFLMNQFRAFTKTLLPQFGVWMSMEERIHYDECCRFEVSFVGKKHLPTLLTFLAEVARATEEICLYVTAGQYTCLLYPASSD